MEYTSCNLCGADSTEKIFGSLYDRALGLPGVFHLVKCKNCGLIYLNPRPSYSEMSEYYPENYDIYEPIKENIFFYLKKRQLKYHYQSEQITIIRCIEKFIFSPVKRYLWGIPHFIKKGKILDIGCGNGYFLYLMRGMGYDLYGIDNNETVVKYALGKGLNIIQTTLDEANFPNNYFDIVRLWHVLEHLHDLSKSLQKIHQLLADKGELIIGIPYFDCLPAKIFKQRWYALEIPRHLYMLTIKTVEKLLEKNGFKIISKNCLGGRSIIGSLQYVLNDLISKITGKQIYGGRLINNRLFVISFSPIEWILNILHIGDTLEIHARKN